MRFVLASASPARLATLRAAGVDPEVIVSGVDEESVRASSVTALVRTLAEVKARAVAGGVEDGIILGCDSLLELDGAGLGKPADAAAAADRWRRLRGRSAVLHTGHALIETRSGQIRSADSETASTTVTFGDISEPEITAYVATGEPLLVAGAFTVDGLGGWFVEGVDGDHHNVVGVSLPLLRRMLLRTGHSLADVGYGRPVDVS